MLCSVCFAEIRKTLTRLIIHWIDIFTGARKEYSALLHTGHLQEKKNMAGV